MDTVLTEFILYQKEKEILNKDCAIFEDCIYDFMNKKNENELCKSFRVIYIELEKLKKIEENPHSYFEVVASGSGYISPWYIYHSQNNQFYIFWKNTLTNKIHCFGEYEYIKKNYNIIEI